MAAILLVLFLVLMFVFALWYLKIRIDSRHLPPEAPGSMFVLGHFFQLSDSAHEQMAKWGKEVGPIFRVHIGPFTTWYVVTSYDLVKEVLQKFADRPNDSASLMNIVGMQVPYGSGIVNASGDLWREQRRFALTVLRDFGFGKAKMEEKVEEEIAKLLELFEDEIGSGNSCILDVELAIKFCIVNIISSVALGRSYPKNDPEFIRLQDVLDRSFKLSTDDKIGILTSFPVLRRVEYFREKLKENEFARANRALEDYFLKVLEEHKAEFSPSNIPEDFISAYLQEMHKRQSKNEDLRYFDEVQLLATIGDLWSAGMETTAHTLRWIILFMIHHLDVQEAVYNEIREVVGFNRTPNLEDRPNMPYTLATIQEVQRMGNIATFTIPHTNLKEDTQIAGYRIPAGSVVEPCLYAVHMNPEYFPDPESFNPLRYLENGTLRKEEHLIPFGMGKRVCMGESLARMEIFLVFTSLIQRYRFEAVQENDKPTLQGQKGFTFTPYPYKCKLIRRA